MPDSLCQAYFNYKALKINKLQSQRLLILNLSFLKICLNVKNTNYQNQLSSVSTISNFNGLTKYSFTTG